MSKKEKEAIERLREAWQSAPYGVKQRVVDSFGYTKQNINDIINNGRKDEALIMSLLLAVKQASADVTKEIYDKNNLVQAV